MKNIITTNGKVEIKKPIELFIEYDDNTVRILFKGDKNNEIVFGNNTKLIVDGDLYIASTGEMGLFTKDSNLCMDSIGGNIFLNSRMAKVHKDDPEAIKYKEQMTQEPQHKECSCEDTIKKLEERIKKLEDGLQTFPI